MKKHLRESIEAAAIEAAASGDMVARHFTSEQWYEILNLDVDLKQEASMKAGLFRLLRVNMRLRPTTRRKRSTPLAAQEQARELRKQLKAMTATAERLLKWKAEALKTITAWRDDAGDDHSQCGHANGTSAHCVFAPLATLKKPKKRGATFVVKKGSR